MAQLAAVHLIKFCMMLFSGYVVVTQMVWIGMKFDKSMFHVFKKYMKQGFISYVRSYINKHLSDASTEVIIITMIRHPVPVQPNHYYKIAIYTKGNVKSIQYSLIILN